MTNDDQDRIAIQAVLQQYIDGIKASSGDHMRAIFHEDSTISREKPEGLVVTPRFRDMIAGFLDSAKPTLNTSPDFDGEILSIDHVADIGFGRIKEKNLDGRNFDTLFLLHKTGGHWLITSKATRSDPA